MYRVCSVNLWRLSGDNKKPKKQEAHETNKEEAKEGNTRNRAHYDDALVTRQASGYD